MQFAALRNLTVVCFASTLFATTAAQTHFPKLTVAPLDELLDEMKFTIHATKPDYVAFIPRVNDPNINDTGNEHFLVFDGPDGSLMAIWTQSTGEGNPDQHIVFAQSRDDGKTWSKTFLPHHDGTITQHAFATLFERPNGGLGLVWLDGRLTVKDRDKGPMTLRYGAYDAQWKQISDRGIDTKVCDCCTTSVAMTADGPIAVYRNRTGDEIRDIYVSRYEMGAWTAGKPVHNDGWHVEACPVNGPVVSAHGKDVVVAWFVAKNDQGQSFTAFSNDSGRSFGNPIRLDDGSSLGKVDIEMLDDGSAVAAYIEFANQRAQFRMRHIERSGAKSAPITIAGASGGRVGGVPRLARSGNELVFEWVETPESGGVGIVKTATAALPH